MYWWVAEAAEWPKQDDSAPIKVVIRQSVHNSRARIIGIKILGRKDGTCQYLEFPRRAAAVLPIFSLIVSSLFLFGEKVRRSRQDLPHDLTKIGIAFSPMYVFLQASIAANTAY